MIPNLLLLLATAAAVFATGADAKGKPPSETYDYVSPQPPPCLSATTGI